MTELILFIAPLLLAVGVGVFWTNPKRLPNQMFFLSSSTTAIWMTSVLRIESIPIANVDRIAFWIRCSAVISAAFPLSVWCIKESITAKTRLEILRKSVPWVVVMLLMVVTCLMPTFVEIPVAPPNVHFTVIRGNPYYIYQAIMVGMDGFLIFQTLRQLHNVTGVKRLEMQFFALNFYLMGLLVTTLLTVANLTKIYSLRKPTLILVLMGHGLTALTLSYHRVYDIKQVFVFLGQRIVLLTGVGGIALLAAKGLGRFEPWPINMFVGIAFGTSLGFWLDSKLRGWLDLDGRTKLAKMRQSVIEIALPEEDPERLITHFEKFLAAENQSGFAELLFEANGCYRSKNLKLDKSSLEYSVLCDLGWTTPESLERRRSHRTLNEMRRYLENHEIAVMIASPAGSKEPSVLIALGHKAKSWPFTYPEVQRLQNVAELIDNILTRSRLALQAAARARVEHLAMMSRGLAHDLKNLITPVSSFLVHTDHHFPTGSTEAEVHADARRSMRVMTEYVREALFFSERLAPKLEPFEFQPLFDTIRELTTALAARRGVELVFVNKYRERIIADSVLIQRLIANLVNNAIDASSPGKKVVVLIEAAHPEWMRLRVTDEGCGIAPETREKIFEPYFTTKQFGDEVRGFGLGLTVCQKIVDVHGGRIFVESQLGRGTVFTVELPIGSPVRDRVAAPAVAHSV